MTTTIADNARTQITTYLVGYDIVTEFGHTEESVQALTPQELLNAAKELRDYINGNVGYAPRAVAVVRIMDVLIRTYEEGMQA